MNCELKVKNTTEKQKEFGFASFSISRRRDDGTDRSCGAGVWERKKEDRIQLESGGTGLKQIPIKPMETKSTKFIAAGWCSEGTLSVTNFLVFGGRMTE